MVDWLKFLATAVLAAAVGYGNFYSRMEKSELRLTMVEDSVKEHMGDHRREVDQIAKQLADIQKDLNQLIGRQSQR